MTIKRQACPEQQFRNNPIQAEQDPNNKKETSNQWKPPRNKGHILQHFIPSCWHEPNIRNLQSTSRAAHHVRADAISPQRSRTCSQVFSFPSGLRMRSGTKRPETWRTQEGSDHTQSFMVQSVWCNPPRWVLWRLRCVSRTKASIWHLRGGLSFMGKPGRLPLTRVAVLLARLEWANSCEVVRNQIVTDPSRDT